MSPSHRFGDYELRPAERKLLRGGDPVVLGARAFDVLLALVQRGGALVTKDELLHSAWPGLVVEEANVHVQVSQLRKLLGADAIATVAGMGYRFAWSLDDAATARSWARRHLPAERTPFIGREAVLAEGARALAGTRLLTLVGIGGTGKTRLALRLAQQVAERHRDGVAWADLAPIDTEQGLILAVAQSLGAALDGSMPPVQALCSALHDSRQLLVLDNCEHLLDAVAALADALLSATPELVLLATSREALGLPGEAVLSVRPLLVPPRGTRDTELEGSEAVRLFVQRAQVARPDIRLRDEATAEVVGEICRQLDGIPLALELAAAQLKVISPAQLLDLLRERFLMLAGPRRALARQQTLHAVIQWSFDQLTSSEQSLLGALAVCRGGCDLTAVTALAGPAANQPLLLSALSRLADMSLISVSRSDPGVARYELLETVRHFALAALQASGSAAAMRERHAAHYLALAERHDQEVARAGATRALLGPVEREHDNLLQALGWFEREGGGVESVAQALRLVVAVRHYWTAGRLLRLGLAMTSTAVLRAERSPTPYPPDRSLMWALISLTVLHHYLGDAEGAVPWARRQLEVAEAITDAEGISIGEGLLGGALQDCGRLDEAQTHLLRSLEQARHLGSARRVGDAQHALAMLAQVRGQTLEALAIMEEVIATRRVDAHGYKLAGALLSAANYLLKLLRPAEARERLTEVLALLPDIGSVALDMIALDTVAAQLSQLRRHDRAAELIGTVQAGLRAQQVPDAPEDQARRARDIEAARMALGEAALAAALADGEATPMPQALLRAERWLAEATPPPRAKGTSTSNPASGESDAGFRTL